MRSYTVSKLILDAGFLKVTINYIQSRKSGLLYYYRRIPEELRGHYRGKRFRLQSLKTRDQQEALRKVAALASADDALWTSLRTPEAKDLGLTTPETRVAAQALLKDLGLSPGEGARTGHEGQEILGTIVDVLDGYFITRYGADYERSRHDEHFAAMRPPQSFYNPVEAGAVRLTMSDPRKPRVLLSDALDHYLRHHKNHAKSKFVKDNTNYIGHVIAAVGDLPLSEYRRTDANKVRDRLIASGVAGSTVRRSLNAITAIFNHGLREFDLRGLGNPFEKLPIPQEGEDSEVRHPFTTEELKIIAAACEKQDDDIRHLIAIQADTGARLAEIVGLRIEDVILDHDVPHICIRPHERLGRTLKNANSERKVPLVGIALWGAIRALEASNGLSKGWLFPRYAGDKKTADDDKNIKATHASNTINKWLCAITKTAKTSHSFRHAMRDRLRHIGTPEELQDAIGGWSNQASIGRGYGEGYRLEQLKGYLERAVASTRASPHFTPTGC
jgi:integrase